MQLFQLGEELGAQGKPDICPAGWRRLSDLKNRLWIILRPHKVICYVFCFVFKLLSAPHLHLIDSPRRAVEIGRH